MKPLHTHLAALFFLLTWGSLPAQVAPVWPVAAQDDSTCVYSMHGWFHGGSDFLTNGHFATLQNGGYVAPATKVSLQSSLGESNLAGALYEFSWEGIHRRRTPFRDSLLSPTLRLGFKRMEEATFSEEAALLALYGNAPFEDQALALGHSHYRHLDFIHIKPGVMRAMERTNGTLFWGVNAGLNLGLRSMDVRLLEGQLYTAPFGESVAFDNRIHFQRATGSRQIKGVGAGVDLILAWQSHRGSVFSVALADIGFITWQRGYAYHRDTTMVWQGIVIDNIFKPGDSWGDGVGLDTLDALFFSYGDARRHTTSTPFTLRADVAIPVSDFPLVVRGTFRYRPQTRMKPLLDVSLDWRPAERLIVSRAHQFGGYGTYSTAFAIQGRVGERLWLFFRATDIYRLVASDLRANLSVQTGFLLRSSSINQRNHTL